MEKSIVRIHDLATDTIIDREMTDAEQADYDATTKAMEDNLQAAESAKAAAQAKLEKLGLTVDDLKALGL